MKIVADENIPLLDPLFGGLGTIVKRPGREISAADVKDADALLVRSVTPVNAELLAGSAVGFVGTCTIGTDHLDKEYLTEAGIAFASAPGCNALGVVQYAVTAMVELGRFNPDLKVGVVGCGNVGGRLYRTLKNFGFDCVGYDPFLTLAEIPDLVDWETLFTCDVICVHTPLTKDGPYPTYHMLDTSFFQKLKAGALLLNAGRGDVIDNHALLDYLNTDNHNQIEVVLDVWESEPDILLPLMDKVVIATPHIAGYSFEGKTNGSLMIYEALAGHLQLESAAVTALVGRVKQDAYGVPKSLESADIKSLIRSTYAIMEDDQRLRDVRDEMLSGFDRLRKAYPVRREFGHFRVSGAEPAQTLQLSALGFQLD